jgi:hypothetical protein
MSALNGKGPENNGIEKGRKLGNCRMESNNSETRFSLEQGMGKRRQAGLKNIYHKQNN